MLQDLNAISDGKVYGLKDMAKVACGDCAGCHACCEDMGNSIILDPLDMYQLTMGVNQTFEQLMAYAIELNIVDGWILPNLKMTQERMCCAFLTADGRCGIHAFRPGLCRVFPLGRIYEDGRLSYFLQTGACRKGTGAKMKVEKWLDTPQLKQNQQFLSDWHSFRKAAEPLVQGENAKQMNMFVLNQFYVKSYVPGREFYEQFYERLSEAEKALGMA